MTGANSYDELPQEIKDRLPKDVREAFHAISNQLGVMILAYEHDKIARSMEKQEREALIKLVELMTSRSTQLEQIITEHISTCEAQRAENKQVLETVQAIKQGMRITNIIRDGFLWVGGVVTTCYAMWEIGLKFFK